ncbi:hypothetical protein [Amnibacterium endophyticum]|uniref:Chitin-binding type-3 domain-containing protein n=1 Tax=Amnibacterium endophyticum TaxID=2109337 RepID=A0ABW4LH76_9MICO
MGSNRRHGDAIARQKDNARAEARALQPTTLPIEFVTAAGGAIPPGQQPRPVYAWVEIGDTLIRIAGTAIAWNSRCVHVRWTGTNPEPTHAWVWASAVTRADTNPAP